MTPGTRRRLMICLILGLVGFPVEAVLLPVARTPDPGVAAMEWAADLSRGDLQAASFQIDAFPPIYRRAIMRELEPRDRADVWRGHIRKFLRANTLTRAQKEVLDDAVDLMDEEAFTPPVGSDLKNRIM